MSLNGFINNYSRGTITFLCGMLLVAAASGCTQKSPWETTYPVTGVITHDGRPVANAELAFFPEDPATPELVRPKAKSDKDGKFTVWTYDSGDGAPAGKYKITAVHQEVTISKGAAVVIPNDLPAKYSRRDSTDLQIEITTGPNEIPPINLK